MGQNSPPKCLLSVGGKTVLERTLESLRSVGVRDVVMVVGFKSDQIIQEAQTHAKGMKLAVCENPRYTEGAILSLWAARAFLNSDVLIMDADVVCPPLFFERLMRSGYANCLLIDGSSQDTGEEQMVLGKGNRVLFITKKPSLDLLTHMVCFGESVGFFKVSQEAAFLLKQFLEQQVGSGIVTIEHEQVYPALFEKVFVGFERVDGLPWTEIDRPEDLARAEKEIYPQWSKPL